MYESKCTRALRTPEGAGLRTESTFTTTLKSDCRQYRQPPMCVSNECMLQNTKSKRWLYVYGIKAYITSRKKNK
ncbi:hypothetical protein GDO78_012398 [Eleutherodactylus coqui]|uniref:Uncharacterized protein n=1 Tax=Eleutherodactylus coqui TaxID=57060 RepID=A0A8J6K4U2_ELECQ|nr:hypothetical protein GDO78_012398 [Eleutherodactylus coqui]